MGNKASGRWLTLQEQGNVKEQNEIQLQVGKENEVKAQKERDEAHEKWRLLQEQIDQFGEEKRKREVSNVWYVCGAQC